MYEFRIMISLRYRIGLDIARRLGLDGCKVVVSSRKEANVDRAKAQLKSEGIDVIGVPCNVGLDEDRRKLVEATVETFGGVDILVNNAAANPFFGHILDVSTFGQKYFTWVARTRARVGCG